MQTSLALDIAQPQLDLVMGLLSSRLPDAVVFAFGSRVRNWPFGRGSYPIQIWTWPFGPPPRATQALALALTWHWPWPWPTSEPTLKTALCHGA